MTQDATTVAPAAVTPWAFTGTPAAISRTVLLGVQLALLAVIIDLFNIESEAFLQLSLLAFGGALIHGLLPLQHRMMFFAVLSLAGIALVFGATQGVWLVGCGAALIGICHLPLSLRARVLLLVAAAAALAFLRTGAVEGPWSPAIWPILGSMFMFRLVVYLYDLRHETEPRSLWRTLSYFFLLPNVCFPMFPVVDYKTFKRTYYNADAAQIRHVGVEWILRGLVQLILYRFVYYYLTMSAEDVTNPTDLGRFMVANYLLYLRISGQFHVVVGILRLFGFNLPETHHRYLFASSINDFWRRINIYWKDFMMKLFYYPSFFALKKRGMTERSCLVLATLVVFVSTWLLHSYQWFWLRGTFPLTWPDGLFWGILGLLVVGNTLWESSKGRTRRLTAKAFSPADFVGVALRTALTFGFICVLWSLWTAESVTQWLALWSNAFDRGVSLQSWHAVAVGGLAAVGASAVSPGGSTAGRNGPPSPFRRGLVTTGAILAVCVVGYPRFYTLLDTRTSDVIASIREQKLSEGDAALLERGYYENLLSVERFNSQLWELYSKRPANWGNLRDEGGMRATDGFLLEELIPSIEIPFKGTRLRTNRWGMRAGDYETMKPLATRRVVLLGPSDTMGAGVDVEQTFGAVLERQLNESSEELDYQVLNFATSNYTPPQHLWLLENRAMQFDPDVVLLVGHDDDAERAVRHVASILAAGIAVPYAPLREIASRAGVTEGMSEQEIRRRLTPETEAILGWTYHRIAEICRERGVDPVWVFLPFLIETVEEADQVLIRHAREAGFAVLDLSRLYNGRDISKLRIADWDLHHPNVEGHAMIAGRLHAFLRDRAVPAEER